MANTTKNRHNCPFLHRSKMCFHKSNSQQHIKNRKICSYKDCNKCVLYQEWLEDASNYDLGEKVSPGAVSVDLNHTPQPARPKRCKVCKKILASHNKSGYCSFHYKIKNQTK